MDWKDKHLWPRILAIKGAVIFLVFTSVAAAHYPGYSFWHNYLSDLGKERASAPFFNIGVILTGITMLALFGILAARKSPVSLRVPVVAACIASIGLVGVGVYPSTMPLEHTISALSFFAFMGAAVILFSKAYWEEGSRGLALFGAAAFAVDMLSITQSSTDLGPGLQKVAVAMLLVFTLLFVHCLPQRFNPSQPREEKPCGTMGE